MTDETKPITESGGAGGFVTVIAEGSRAADLQALQDRVRTLEQALRDALILTRNYYGGAVSRAEVEQHQEQWRATLTQPGAAQKEEA